MFIAPTVPDPDLEIRGPRSSRSLDKGGGWSPKKCSRPLGRRFGLKIGGTGSLTGLSSNDLGT